MENNNACKRIIYAHDPFDYLEYLWQRNNNDAGCYTVEDDMCERYLFFGYALSCPGYEGNHSGG